MPTTGSFYAGLLFFNAFGVSSVGLRLRRRRSREIFVGM